MRPSTALAALLALALPGTAWAQDAAPAEQEAAPAKDEPAASPSATGNAVLVTATRREQPLQQVPVAITVASGETLEQAHIRDIIDLATLVPSLRALPAAPLTIRGFGLADSDLGAQPIVGVFVDGVYHPRPALILAAFPDIAQIEVLRGPQTVLYGKNAAAGVITITTDQPQFKPGGDAELSYGNGNAFIARGQITGAVTKDIALSLGAGYDGQDGFIHNAVTGHDLGDRNRWFVRAQALYEPGTQLKLRLIADYARLQESCCAMVSLRAASANGALGSVNAHPFADVVSENVDPSRDARDYGVSGQLDYALGPLTFTAITAARKTRQITGGDADFTSADLLDVRGNATHRSFTQELRATTNITGPLNFVVGALYSSQHTGQASQTLYGTDFAAYANGLIEQASGGALGLAALEGQLGAAQGNPALYSGQFFAPGQGLATSYDNRDHAISTYAQVDFKPRKRITLTAGLNFLHDVQHGSSASSSTDVFSSIGVPAVFTRFQFLPGYLAVPNALQSGRTSDSAVTWAARAAYDATDDIRLYAAASTGFRPSTFDVASNQPALTSAIAVIGAGEGAAGQTSGARAVEPEHVLLFEGGMKAQWNSTTLNLTIFRQRINGLQASLFNGQGFDPADASRETVAGFSVETIVHPLRELTLSQSSTVLRARYSDFAGPAQANGAEVVPAGVPTLALTAAAIWDHARASGDHIVLRGDWHFESRSRIADALPAVIANAGVPAAIAAARPFIRQVSTLDASLTYRLHDGLDLTLWGRNLNDNRYIVAIFDAPAQPGGVAGTVNQPRSYGASAVVHF